MKNLALALAAAAAIFAAVPVTAEAAPRDGMRHGSMHRGHHMSRPHVRRAPRIVVMPRRHHQRRGHMMH